MKVTVYGTGYVGLVTGACLADVGNEVVCVDTDSQRVTDLNNNIIPIFEPGLAQLVQRNAEAGRLSFTESYDEGVAHGLFQFLAVPTPSADDGSADLGCVMAACEAIARRMSEYRIIINKSTVPVGTGDQVKDRITSVLRHRDMRLDFDVVSNPEFLKEGAAIQDFTRPDRIVVGTDNVRTAELLKSLYAPYNRNHDRFISMDIRSAELTKYAANSMLATKISFINELANIAEKTGADIEKVRIGIGSDSRIGYHFIYPGVGYGGSCFPKDVKALISTAMENDYHPELLRSVENINRRQKLRLTEKIACYFDKQLAGRRFALWGLSFKPNTDDMREAPSRVIIDFLLEQGAVVMAYDPKAMPLAMEYYAGQDNFICCADPEAALEKADALVIVTEWREFQSPDFVRIRDALHQPVIFDGRNLYDPDLLQELGFDYFSIGRGCRPARVTRLALKTA